MCLLDRLSNLASMNDSEIYSESKYLYVDFRVELLNTKQLICEK